MRKRGRGKGETSEGGGGGLREGRRTGGRGIDRSREVGEEANESRAKMKRRKR